MGNKIYWLNIDDKIIEKYSYFLWTWNPEKSEIWLIWNEEAFDKWENAKKKFNKYNLNSNNNEFTFWDYFTKKFYDCHNESEVNDNHNDIWNIIKKLTNTSIEHLFLWEFYFLPSNLGTWLALKQEYWWKTLNYKVNIKWEKYYDRECFYEANWLINLFENRIDIIFELISTYKPKLVIFYWNDSVKIRYLRKKLKDPTLKSDIDIIQKSDYLLNEIVILPFINEDFLKLKAYSWIKIYLHKNNII